MTIRSKRKRRRFGECRAGADAELLDALALLRTRRAPYDGLLAEGLVPIPNVIGDPGDHEWPLGIVLFKRDCLTGLLAFGLRTNHPLTCMFGLYFQAFLADPFDVKEATTLFKTIAVSDDLRPALAAELASACQMALQQGYAAVAAIPFHSGRYLSRVLEASFARNSRFRIVFSQIVTRSEWRPLTDEGVARYRSLCLGHERIADQFPKRMLTVSARNALASGNAPKNNQLIEAGVFVFVAERL